MLPVCRVCVAVTAGGRSPRSGPRWPRSGMIDRPRRGPDDRQARRRRCVRRRTRPRRARVPTAPRSPGRRHRRGSHLPRAEGSIVPARRPHAQSSVRRTDVRRRRRHVAGAAAGSGFLHRSGGRSLRVADAQCVDVLPARVRTVSRRHLWSGDVALLVLSRFPRHRRVSPRDPRGGTRPQFGAAAVGQADHHRSGPRRRRPRRDHQRVRGSDQRSRHPVGLGQSARGPDDGDRHGDVSVAARATRHRRTPNGPRPPTPSAPT